MDSRLVVLEQFFGFVKRPNQLPIDFQLLRSRKPRRRPDMVSGIGSISSEWDVTLRGDNLFGSAAWLRRAVLDGMDIDFRHCFASFSAVLAIPP